MVARKRLSSLAMLRYIFSGICLALAGCGYAQLRWINVDSAFQPLPSSVHVYYTQEPLDTAPFRAYYVIADLRSKSLDFDVDTTFERRMTPSEFFQRNNQPLIVVNTTFFSFETNRNLNAVVRHGRLVGFNIHSLPGRGKDTFTYRHAFGSAIGFYKNGRADVAWLVTDSSRKWPLATQRKISSFRDSLPHAGASYLVRRGGEGNQDVFKKWKVHTAVGGGPVLVQNGLVDISNNEEIKFAGKAIYDKHPRTAMGYTKEGQLIILVIEGRNPAAGGADLLQEAKMLQDLGCVEAINLDGGGSSCLLINGKETINPSDKKQRPVPAVFLIRSKKY